LPLPIFLQCAICTNPIWVLKTRLQIQEKLRVAASQQLTKPLLVPYRGTYGKAGFACGYAAVFIISRCRRILLAIDDIHLLVIGEIFLNLSYHELAGYL
jgi:hypothetical protein